MKEYIEKELLKEQFLKWLPPDGDWDYVSTGLHPVENIAVSAIMEIEEAPTADVKEVNHGKWLDDYGYDKCSVCGFKCNDPYYLGEANYCPECGARMDLD